MSDVDATFIEADGTVYSGSGHDGQSLMQLAVALGVPGIWAECGGMCACATCHCYVLDEFLGLLEPKSTTEEGMLTAARDPAPNSRLSCQIRLRPAIAGITVLVPKTQA